MTLKCIGALATLLLIGLAAWLSRGLPWYMGLIIWGLATLLWVQVVVELVRIDDATHSNVRF